MATLKFRVKASSQGRAIREINRGFSGSFEQEVKPSKMSDQDVIVTLSYEGDKLPVSVYRNSQGMAANRAIYLIK